MKFRPRLHTSVWSRKLVTRWSLLLYTIRYLVIHFTANDGDTAKNNADYFAREAPGVSAHFFVDEKEIWQSVREKDIAWHCGTRGMYFHPYCRNANSIGIELCSRKISGQYTIPEATQRRAAALVRQLLTKHGLDETCVIRHYDVTGKLCPEPLVRDGAAWARFLTMVKEEIDMTEQQLRAIVREEITSALRGADTSVSAALADEWQTAMTRGITDGSRPGGYATRAQVAAMIVRAAGK